MDSFFNTKGNRVMGTLVLLMIIIALGAYAKFTFKQANYINSGPATISVSGEGEVLAVPDIGQFSFSVNAEGESASTAQEESSEKINSILSYLEEQGVEEKDIKTENYNMHPKYRYEQEPCLVGSYCPPGEQIQDGFEVSQTVRVRVRELDEAGTLLAGVGDLGATNISNLQFTIDESDDLKDQARAMAISEARAKAEILADELGVKIVRMIGYYENEGRPEPYYGYGGEEAMDRALSSFAAPQIPVGENSTKSQVSITYQVE